MSERARRDLVERARALVEAVGTTGADDAVMKRVSEALAGVSDALGPVPGASVPAPSFAEAAGAPSYHAAQFNVALPDVAMTFADGGVEATVRLGRVYEGPRGAVHGGVVALLMDTLLASLVQQTGLLCVTASLTVDYRARTPLEQNLRLVGRVDSVGEKKVLASGSILCSGNPTAEARGLFVRVPFR